MQKSIANEDKIVYNKDTAKAEFVLLEGAMKYIYLALTCTLFSVQFIFTKLFSRRAGNAPHVGLWNGAVIALLMFCYLMPLNGFVLYSGLGNDMTNFWERYEAFQSANGIVNVCDYANTLLIRGNWAQLNPEEGL